MATPDLAEERRAIDAALAGHDPTTDGRNASALAHGLELMAAWAAEDELVVIDLRDQPATPPSAPTGLSRRFRR